MREVIFNNRLYNKKETEEKVYLQDKSDNKIKIHMSFSKNEEENINAKNAIKEFIARGI